MTQIIDLVKRNARLAALIAVVIILVIVAFVFYSGSQSSADEQAKLEKQVASAKVNLNLAQDQYDLAKLQTEQASLTGSPSFLPSFPSVGLSAYIAGAADKYGVELVSLTPKGAVGAETIGGQKYTRYDTGVEVTGDHEAMNSFLSYLEAGPFLSLRLENVSFTPSGGTFTVVILTRS
jgi:type II secretory pathway pseudopilin PulG